ncbi:AbrB family transcriptional regulator [Sporolactobacillus sp. THM19-2]|jgi:membrane AbrB-like protein|uniref:AbrB family transcriptional regulator n=1 Tax=Sporolactobacillus sp. THM19-2 TaxID=2511171 RepID=UPI001020E8A0|nr:AbrB family transcriptional regulator [Sporolactobacillus sp. THM19-2]RYL87554.1 AbrB family transcriptional regulator [Sporolactobacillus sp. THM19-2]
MKSHRLRPVSEGIIFLLISGTGGFLLSLTGLSIGWMVGTLLLSGWLGIGFPKFTHSLIRSETSGRNWLRTGQLLLGIQMGRQVNASVIRVFREHGLLILLMMILSVFLALLTGFMLHRFSRTDLVTSFYATTPGGLSSMIGIAEEAGANLAVVSVIQTLRVILVVSSIPVALSLWSGAGSASAQAGSPFTEGSLFPGLACAAGLSALCIFLGLRLHMPAPWLIGSMIGTSVVQVLLSTIGAGEAGIWWHPDLIILAQVLIGSAVGCRLSRKMFAGLGRITLIGLIGSIALTGAMILFALIVSHFTGVPGITSILAFAPGGIAEMAATSVVVHADATFVVSCQVLRVLTICIVLPPFFTFLLHRRASHARRSPDRS